MYVTILNYTIFDLYSMQFSYEIQISVNKIIKLQMQMQIRNQQMSYSMQNNEGLIGDNSKKGLFGFKARMFPLLGAIVSTVTVLWTYHVARRLLPPHVDPFPWTDITHCAIKFPQYVIFRIGMMVAPVLFCISFQILKNYLTIKSYEITGQGQRRVRHFGILSIMSCLFLCLSTSTISDGHDMDWTLHTIGASSFFILAMYMCVVASKIYRQLHFSKPNFCSYWSFLLKKYTNWIVVFFLTLTILDKLKVITIGSLIQWAATFYLIAFFATLYDDFKDMDIMMEPKKRRQSQRTVNHW